MASETPRVVHLPVLVSSNKAAALREELAADRTAGAVTTAAPVQPPAAIATVQAPVMSDTIRRKLLEGKVIDAIRKVYDPEIPVNLYDLGLIYEINVADDASVKVKMTLTAPACPVAGSLPGEVEKQIENIPEVKSADVELVWEPAWTRDRMSEAAQLELGF